MGCVLKCQDTVVKARCVFLLRDINLDRFLHLIADLDIK